MVNYTIYYVDTIFTVCGDQTPTEFPVSASLFSQHSKGQGRSLQVSSATGKYSLPSHHFSLTRDSGSGSLDHALTTAAQSSCRSIISASSAGSGSLDHALTTTAQSSSQSIMSASTAVHLLPFSLSIPRSVAALKPMSALQTSVASASSILCSGSNSSSEKKLFSRLSRTSVPSLSGLAAATHSSSITASAAKTVSPFSTAARPVTLVKSESTSKATVLSKLQPTLQSTTYACASASVSLSDSSASILSPTSVVPPSEKWKLGGGALAGIVIGCCLALIACFAVGRKIYRRRNLRKRYALKEYAKKFDAF